MKTRPSDGQRRLAAWLQSTGTTVVDFARRASVSTVTVHAWKGGAKAPRIDKALTIETLTGGAVRVGDWMPDDERKRLDDGKAA